MSPEKFVNVLCVLLLVFPAYVICFLEYDGADIEGDFASSGHIVKVDKILLQRFNKSPAGTYVSLKSNGHRYFIEGFHGVEIGTFHKARVVRGRNPKIELERD